MRNSFLPVIASAALLSSAAMAADIPARAPAPAPAPMAAPIFTWTGFYVGVNIGGSFRNNSNRVPAPTGAFLLPGNAAFLPFATLPASRSNRGSILAGVTIGYNWQSGNFVYGVEGDLNYAGRSGRNRNTFTVLGVPPTPFAAPGAAPNSITFIGNRDRDRLFGTARLRLGYAADRALFYVTGGVAFRDNSGTGAGVVTYRNSAGTVIANFASPRRNNNKFGWVVGAGVEYAFTNNWSMKGEYLYAKFNNNNTALLVDTTAGGAAAGGFTYTTTRTRNDSHILRVGLNYRF